MATVSIGQDKVIIGDIIGKGGYGHVYRGQRNNGRNFIDAAFKTDFTLKDDFKKEIKFLEDNDLNHMFILKFFGTTNVKSFR